MVNFYIVNALGQNFRIMAYSDIVVRGQNLSFQVICQKMAMFEEVNDQFLVNSK